MTQPIQFAGETKSNAVRQIVAEREPLALRTFTPSQAVFAKSAGVYHWTPEGRKLFDYSSGVLVANLGHNPKRWMQHFAKSMGWTAEMLFGGEADCRMGTPARPSSIPKTGRAENFEHQNIIIGRSTTLP